MIRLRDFSEHVCVSDAEREFLFKKGIKYNFVKEDGFVMWKYIKTPELYRALAEYQEFLLEINNNK